MKIHMFAVLLFALACKREVAPVAPAPAEPAPAVLAPAEPAVVAPAPPPAVAVTTDASAPDGSPVAAPAPAAH